MVERFTDGLFSIFLTFTFAIIVTFGVAFFWSILKAFWNLMDNKYESKKDFLIDLFVPCKALANPIIAKFKSLK
jgi:hypothetical protein